MNWMLAAVLPACASAAALDDLEFAVARAVQSGARFLRANVDQVKQDDDPRIGGAAPLALWTLLACDTSPLDPVVEELRRETILALHTETRTFAVSCALVALLWSGDQESAAGREAREDEPAIEISEVVETLLVARVDEGEDAGGFRAHVTCVVPDGDVGEESRPADTLSTHMALFALRLAVEHGVAVDGGVFRDGASYLVERQNRDGGFGHARRDRPQSALLPTAAGVAALALSSEMLSSSGDLALRRRAAFAIGRGSRRIAKNLTFPPRDAGSWPYLAMTMLERFDWYVPDADLGRRGDWRRDAARWVVGTQLPDGGFGDPAELIKRTSGGFGAGGAGLAAKKSRLKPTVHGVFLRSCFALQFLARATRRLGSMSEDTSRLAALYDPGLPKDEIERIERRLSGFGKRAMPPLLVLLRREDWETAAFADRCLRRLTGRDMGFGDARTPEGRRRAIERWADLYLESG